MDTSEKRASQRGSRAASSSRRSNGPSFAPMSQRNIRPSSTREQNEDEARRLSQRLSRSLQEQENRRLRASIGFNEWKRDSLESALKNARVQVPRGSTHAQLVALARTRFDGDERKSLPKDKSGRRIRYTSRRTGVKYVERVSREGKERPSSIRHDGYLYFRNNPILPTSAAQGMLGSTPPPSSFRSMQTLREEDFSFTHAGFTNADDDGYDSDEDVFERRQARLEKAMHDEFIKPSLRKAKIYARDHHPRTKSGALYPFCATSTGRHGPSFGPSMDYICGKTPSDFSRFGPGVVLYFKWLKWLSWVFLALSLIAGPQLFFNVMAYSGRLYTGIGALEATEMSSISETGLNKTFVSSSILIGGGKVIEPFLDCDDECLIERQWFAYLYSFTNLGLISFFLLSVGYLKLYESKEDTKISKFSVSLDDYTVQMVKTPPTAGEGALKRFFAEFVGEPVTEVNIAHNDGKLIQHYMKRGRIIHKLWKAASRVYMLREEKSKAEEAAVEALMEQRRKSLQAPNRKSRPKSGNSSTGPTRTVSLRKLEDVDLESGPEGAAVNSGSEHEDSRPKSRRYTLLLSLTQFKDAVEATAERVGLLESKLDRAIAAYDLLYAEFEQLNEQHRFVHAGTKARSAFITFETQIGYLRCLDLFSEHSRTKVKYHGITVQVRPAPPPSTILWENFDFSSVSKFFRRIVTTLMVLLVVGLSIGFTYAGSLSRQVLKNEIATSKCTLPVNVSSINDLEWLLQTKSTEVPQDEDLVKSLESAYLECACGLVTYSQAASAAIDPSDPCFSFWVDKAPLFGYTFGITFLIAITNYMIRAALIRLAEFEKHQSLVGMELSLSLRVFLTLFFNTALVLFLVNYDFSVFGFDSESSLGINGYSDFLPNWYADVGLQLVLIMVTNIFAPHIFLFLEFWFVKYYKRNRRCKRPSSQRELNEWFTGPVFRVNYRIAHNLMTAFVTLTFGPGLPVLYPCAALSFYCYYWVDKFMLIRYFQTPPRYDARLAHQSSHLLLVAVILNLVSAIWMYSAPGFFWFPETSEIGTDSGLLGNAFDVIFRGVSARTAFKEIRTRLSLPFIVPTLMFLVIFTLLFVLGSIFRPFAKFLSDATDFVLCGFVKYLTVTTVYIHPPLYVARKRGLLRGLDSYSILRNPTYSTSFGIDESFAQRHRTVGEMQNLSVDQLPTLPMV